MISGTKDPGDRSRAVSVVSSSEGEQSSLAVSVTGPSVLTSLDGFPDLGERELVSSPLLSRVISTLVHTRTGYRLSARFRVTCLWSVLLHNFRIRHLRSHYNQRFDYSQPQPEEVSLQL